jgi:ClpP class serine protease
MTAKLPALTALAALRAQPWAIQPEYLQAAEDILGRVAESAVLTTLALDGHAERHQATMEALAGLGAPLEGARRATVREGVAVLPVLGVIAPRVASLGLSSGGTSLDTLAADLRAAEASPDVRQILLLVDSPGGQVAGLGEMAGMVAVAAKPVTAFVQGDAASAAYWLASQAGEIVADSTAALGSIGVVASIQRRVGPNRDGVVTHEIVSAGAPDKRADVGTEEGRAGMQALVDAIEEEFVGAVAAGRKVSAETVRRDFGRGGMLAARAALKAGMADRVDTLEATITRLAGLARASSTTRKGARPMAESESTATATQAEAENTVQATMPPAPSALDAVAAERERVGAILAAQKPGFEKLAHLAVKAGWSAETFVDAQAAAEPAQVAAAADAFRASLPAPVATAPAAAAAPQTPEDKLKAEWDGDEKLRAEFGDFGAFAAYRAAEARGLLGARRHAA